MSTIHIFDNEKDKYIVNQNYILKKRKELQINLIIWSKLNK